ncbi:Efflux pump dotC [Penicillium frequentans]|nr:Efflux pump dotC [Penicillium glabrum]
MVALSLSPCSSLRSIKQSLRLPFPDAAKFDSAGDTLGSAVLICWPMRPDPLSDIWGRKLILLIAVAWFLISSIICAA